MALASPLPVLAQWTTNGNTVYLEAGKYLGIGGTASVAHPLDVKSEVGRGINLYDGAAPWNYTKILTGAGGNSQLVTSYQLSILPDNNNAWTYIDTGVGIDYLATSTAIGAKNAFRIRTGYTGTPKTLFTILGNGNVGIGTASPQSPIHVRDAGDGSDIWSGIRLIPAGASETRGHRVSGFRKGGLWLDGSSSGNVYALSNIFLGDAGVSFGMSDGNLDPTTAAQTKLVILNGGNVGIGTTTPTQKLTVNGTIQAKEVIVTNAISADYVFRPGYKLRPLAQVASFIKQYGHLPDIPSEKEVQEKGISIAEMEAKLLAKVEELTLHVIAADRRIERLEAENRLLRLKSARESDRK